MTTPPPPAPPRPPGRPAPAGNWLQAHKGIAAGGALAAAVITIALYERSKNSSSSSPAATATGTATPGTYDSTSQNTYDALEQQIAGLQSMIGQSSTAAGSAGSTAGPTAAHYPAPSRSSDTPYDTYVDLGWGSVPGAHQYHYQVLNSRGGVVSDQTTSALNARVPGLKKRTPYKWRVSVTPNGSWTPETGFETK